MACVVVVFFLEHRLDSRSLPSLSLRLLGYGRMLSLPRLESAAVIEAPAIGYTPPGQLVICRERGVSQETLRVMTSVCLVAELECLARNERKDKRIWK